jgi:hypothetical protein
MLIELAALNITDLKLSTRADLTKKFENEKTMEFANVNHGRSSLEIRVRGKVTASPTIDEYDRTTFTIRPSVSDMSKLIVLENIVNESTESDRMVRELGFATKEDLEEKFGETYPLLRENQLKIKLRTNDGGSRWLFLCNRATFTPENSEMVYGESVTVALSLGLYFNEMEGKSGWYTVLKDLSFDGTEAEENSAPTTPKKTAAGKTVRGKKAAK